MTKHSTILEALSSGLLPRRHFEGGEGPGDEAEQLENFITLKVNRLFSSHFMPRNESEAWCATLLI